mmetsp:Transcript_24072/g.53069  ORF Transcript_24072/g.53069 Transcript_24072/m.53069 type:complete len:307 (-) Transcript_24072:92-1012(-)
MVLIAWQAMSSTADGEDDQPQGADSSWRQQLEIVVGEPMHDNGMVKFFRRVILLATFIAAWSVSDMIITLLQGETEGKIVWSLMTALMFQLSIPACGYFGAVHTNLPLTCCFSGCNVFLAILTIIRFIRGHINVAKLSGDCSKEADPEKKEYCEFLVGDDGFGLYLNHGKVLLWICVDCLGFWFGAALYQKLTQESGGTRYPHVVVGDPLLVAPQGIGRSIVTFTRGQDVRVHASTNDGSGTTPVDPELATWVNRAVAMAQINTQGIAQAVAAAPVGPLLPAPAAQAASSEAAARSHEGPGPVVPL